MKTKLTEENGSNSINLINRKTGHLNSPHSYWILQLKWRKQMVWGSAFKDYGWCNVKHMLCVFICIVIKVCFIFHRSKIPSTSGGCMNSCPCQAEALIHQGEPNLSLCQKLKEKNTNDILLLFFIWSDFLSYIMSQTWHVQQWFSVYKILCCTTVLRKWNAFKTSKKSWVSWGDFRKAVIGGGLPINLRWRARGQDKIYIKHISLWQMLLYAYCLLYCDNIRAGWYGLYKHFTSISVSIWRVNVIIFMMSVKSLLCVHSLRRFHLC